MENKKGKAKNNFANFNNTQFNGKPILLEQSSALDLLILLIIRHYEVK